MMLDRWSTGKTSIIDAYLSIVYAYGLIPMFLVLCLVVAAQFSFTKPLVAAFIALIAGLLELLIFAARRQNAKRWV